MELNDQPETVKLLKIHANVSLFTITFEMKIFFYFSGFMYNIHTLWMYR